MNAHLPDYIKCICGTAPRPADLIHRGGDDWQCPHCFGWALPVANPNTTADDPSPMPNATAADEILALRKALRWALTCARRPLGAPPDKWAQRYDEARALAGEASCETCGEPVGHRLHRWSPTNVDYHQFQEPMP